MNESKIPVYVTITRFTGLGRHVHVEMREEVEPHGDGELRVMSFTNRERALEWVRHTFAQSFSGATHCLPASCICVNIYA